MKGVFLTDRNNGALHPEGSDKHGLMRLLPEDFAPESLLIHSHKNQDVVEWQVGDNDVLILTDRFEAQGQSQKQQTHQDPH